VEHFIAEDLFEQSRARRRIVTDDIAIKSRNGRRPLFRHMQEGEQTMVGFSFDGQVVEPMPPGRGLVLKRHFGAESSAA